MGVWVAPAPPAPSVVDRAGRSPGGRLTSALLVVSVLLAVVAGAGAAAGYRGVSILSGSMEPAIAEGDLVVVDRIAAGDLRVGDVVTFQAEAGHSVTHRVTALREEGGALAVTTRGDANAEPERWRTTPDAAVGRTVATVPELGRLTRWTASRDGRLLVLGTLSVLGAGVLLRRIWAG